MDKGTWKFNNINIAVEKDSEDYTKPRIPVQMPLDAISGYIYDAGSEAYYRDLQIVMFSGYHNNIIPLLGIDYYTLESDQGEEGSYMLVNVSQNRLYDRIHPLPVFRANLQLRGISVILPQGLLATKTKGMYYSNNLILGDDSIPIWEKIETNLDTLNFWDCDRSNPLSLQVCSSSNTIYLRRLGISDGDWVEICDTDTMTTVTGDNPSTGLGWLVGDVAYNYLFDEIYFTALPRSSGSNGYHIWFFKSTDFGDNWTATLTYSSSFPYARRPGPINISYADYEKTQDRGDVIRVGQESGAGSSGTVVYSVDRGETWSTVLSIATGGWTAAIYSDRHYQHRCYIGKNSGGTDLSVSNNWGWTLTDFTIIDGTYQAGLAEYPYYTCLWTGLNDPDIIYSVRTNDFYSTLDGGTNWVTATRLNDLTLVTGRTLEDRVLIGSFSSGIADPPDYLHTLWSTADQGTTFWPKDGAHWETADTGGGDSIPYNCGGHHRNSILWGNE